MEFKTYKVEKIVEETADTKSFYFQVEPENKGFKAGQYITVSVHMDGGEVRRSYSLCTAPKEELVGFSVKRVKGGLMSNFLHDAISIGDTLALTSAEGRFVLEPEADIQRDHYFITAGSGITPIMSMIKTVLEEEPLSTCYLLYGSRCEDQVIFQKELETLSEKYQDQLYVVHTLSQPSAEKAKGLSGLLGKSTIAWKGEVGRISAEKIERFLNDYPSKSGRSYYYLCGPGNLIETTEKYLEELGVIKENISKEYFTTKTESVSTGEEGNVIITLDRKDYAIHVNENESILDAAIRNKIDAPYSCTSAACSSCMAKVKNGEISMDTCLALDDEEVAEGYILTCQSKLVSSKVEITYDI